MLGRWRGIDRGGRTLLEGQWRSGITHGRRRRLCGKAAEGNARMDGGPSNRAGRGPDGPTNPGSQMDNGRLGEEARGTTPSTGSPGPRGGQLAIKTGARTLTVSGCNGAELGTRPVPGGAARPKTGRDKQRAEGAEIRPTGQAAPDHAKPDHRRRTETPARTGGPGERHLPAAAPATLTETAGGRAPALAAQGPLHKTPTIRGNVPRTAGQIQGTGVHPKGGLAAAECTTRPLSASLGAARVVCAVDVTLTATISARAIT